MNKINIIFIAIFCLSFNSVFALDKMMEEYEEHCKTYNIKDYDYSCNVTDDYYAYHFTQKETENIGQLRQSPDSNNVESSYNVFAELVFDMQSIVSRYEFECYLNQCLLHYYNLRKFCEESHMTLRGVPIKKIQKLMKVCTIFRLNLGCTADTHLPLRDEGCHILSNILLNNTKMHSLDLTNNDITQEGARHLAYLLKVNTSLLSLELCGNPLTQNRVNHKELLLQKTIKSILLVKKIDRQLKDLDIGERYLDVRDNHGNVDLLKFQEQNMERLSHVRKIDSEIKNKLANPTLSAAEKQDLETKRTLNLKKISQILDINSLLIEMEKGGNQNDEPYKDFFADTFQRNNTLLYLGLRWCQIGSNLPFVSDLCGAIQSNRSLTTLDLSMNCIDDQMVVRLFQSLKSNRTLRTLLLAGNKIITTTNNRLEGYEAITHFLKTNGSLTELDLSNTIHVLTLKDLAPVRFYFLQKPKTLLVREALQILLEGIKEARALRVLKLADNNINDDSAIIIFRILNLPISLEDLDLSGNFISIEEKSLNKGAVRVDLRHNTSVPSQWKNLTIESIGIEDLFERDLHVLREMKIIMKIQQDLQDLLCDKRSDPYTGKEKETRDRFSLRNVILEIEDDLGTLENHNKPIVPREFLYAPRDFNNECLVTIKFDFHDKNTESAFSEFCEQAQVYSLCLDGQLKFVNLALHVIPIYKLRKLVQFIHIVDLDLSRMTMIDSLITDHNLIFYLQALLGSKAIRSLNLSGNLISSQGTQQLVKFMDEHPTLVHLELENNNVGNEGGLALAHLLRQNNRLRFLGLSWCALCDSFTEITSALKENRGLTKLDLSINAIKDEKMVTLFEALEENRTLRILKLSGNYLFHLENSSFMECEAAARFLARNKTLMDLDLSSCISMWNPQDVKKMPRESNSYRPKIVLTKMPLMNANQAIGKIFMSLEQNTSLKTLTLENNYINDDGADYLLQALQKNTTLITLNLSKNYIQLKCSPLMNLARGLPRRDVNLSYNGPVPRESADI